MKQYPTISVVIATYYSGSTLTECLQSIRMQDYPKEKIEIILADGGYHDTRADVAGRFSSKVIRE